MATKPRLLQHKAVQRVATAKHALLEIINNRTGAVSSDEIYGAFINNWEIPADLKQGERQWIAVCLCELKRIGMIETKELYKTGYVSESGRPGASLKAMYDITESGIEYLTICESGTIPKIPQYNQPATHDVFINPDSDYIRFAKMPPPSTAHRQHRPAAHHMGVGA